MDINDKKSSMVFYESYMLSAKEAQLSPAQRCEFYEALMSYVFYQETPNFDSVIMRCLFTAFKVSIDNNLRKLARHRAAVENGKKGAAKRYSVNNCKSNNNLANDLAKNQNVASISNSNSNSNSNSVSVCVSTLENTHTQTNTQTDTEREKNNTVEERETFTATKTIQERNMDFYKSLLPFIPKYGLQHISKFYEYWGEPTQDRRFLRFEKEVNWNLQARLNRWKK